MNGCFMHGLFRKGPWLHTQALKGAMKQFHAYISSYATFSCMQQQEMSGPDDSVSGLLGALQVSLKRGPDSLCHNLPLQAPLLEALDKETPALSPAAPVADARLGQYRAPLQRVAIAKMLHELSQVDIHEKLTRWHQPGSALQLTASSPLLSVRTT